MHYRNKIIESDRFSSVSIRIPFHSIDSVPIDVSQLDQPVIYSNISWISIRRRHKLFYYGLLISFLVWICYNKIYWISMTSFAFDTFLLDFFSCRLKFLWFVGDFYWLRWAWLDRNFGGNSTGLTWYVEATGVNPRPNRYKAFTPKEIKPA